MISRSFLLPIAFVAGVMFSQPAFTAAGRLILAEGDVAILDSKGIARAAITGMDIDAGETLLTKIGRAQIQFTDGGLISLQPSTEFKINDYRFSKASNSGFSAVFNLIKGGLRAITGLIGKQDRANYRLNTAVATIGIRGTAFNARLCIKDCLEPDGLYVLTTDGIVVVSNIAGEIELGRGSGAYVSTPTTPPRPTQVMPAMSARVGGSAAQPQTPTITAGTLPVIPGVGNDTEFSPGDLETVTPYTPIPIYDAGILLAASGSGSVEFNGKTYTQSGAAIGSGINEPGALVSAYLNGNEVRGFVGEEGPAAGGGIIGDIRNLAGENPYGSHASITFDRVLDVGTSDGVLYWGRWSGANVSLHALLNTQDAQGTFVMPAGVNIHYLLGTSIPAIPEAGSATYSFIGGTSSTDVSGMVGTGIVSGMLDVNFLASNVQANLTIVHDGTYNLYAFMPMGSNRASFGTNYSGGYASTTGAGNYQAEVMGFFAGFNSPTHAGLTYHILRPGNDIVGVGAFTCAPGC